MNIGGLIGREIEYNDDGARRLLSSLILKYSSVIFASMKGAAMIKGLIKEDAIIEINLNAEEAEKFIVAHYGIFKLQNEGKIDLPVQAIDALDVVYQKVAEFINEHNLGNI